MSQPESVRSQSPSPSQTSPDPLQAAVDQALESRWNQLTRHVEAQQREMHQRMQTQLDEGLTAAATVAGGRGQTQSARPALNIVKPPKPPTYEGARQGTFTQWAFQVRQYLRLMHVQDEAYCVEFAAGLFRGTAALWWQNLVETHGYGAIQTWQEFILAAEAQFGVANDRQKARDELARLVQKASVEDYTAKFMDLKTRIRGISDDECLDRFKRGLKPAVRLDVERANPLDLQQAMSHALKADDILFRINGAARNTHSTPVQRPLPRPAPRVGPTPMEVDALQRGDPQELQCHRCRGFGHYAKDCATRQRPGERFRATGGEGRRGGERRHTVTNLECAEEEVQGQEYCGNASHLPKARTTLPCFKAKKIGRAHV